jgi:hypothetical protein
MVCCLTISCLPRDRLASTCSWRGDSAFTVDTRDRTQHEHLALDVRIAEEVGMRTGDSFRPRLPMPETRRIGDACTDSLFGVVERQHGVTPAQIDALRGKREGWVDLFVLYLPIAVLFALVAERIVRRVGWSFEPDEKAPRAVAMLALAPLVAAAGAFALHLWSWFVESLRLRDTHLSYRASRLPLEHHALLFWLIGTALFVAVALYRLPSFQAERAPRARHQTRSTQRKPRPA